VLARIVTGLSAGAAYALYPSPAGIVKAINRLATRQRVATFGPHSLRRFYATELVNRGVDLLTVQRLMGHANLSTLKAQIRIQIRPERSLERETRFELATSTLGRLHSTTELLPRRPPKRYQRSRQE